MVRTILKYALELQRFGITIKIKLEYFIAQKSKSSTKSTTAVTNKRA